MVGHYVAFVDAKLIVENRQEITLHNPDVVLGEYPCAFCPLVMGTSCRLSHHWIAIQQEL
jgi:hypothetical protein